jgi:pyrimidine-nucleoside phosphorylase
MDMIDLLQKKKRGQRLNREEIAYFVKGVTDGSIPDYQISAFTMAVCLRGMDEEETADLTLAMAQSGDVVDLSGIQGVVADKHSTGGVGDTTTLILVPMVAACGVKVAKMSGRGLGHTGGTLDKLEAIPGLRVDFTPLEMMDLVNRHGAAIVGQTGDLVPADKRLYAIRDVTATVDSVALIASSVMSKKLASGAEAIVLDVKTGSGAFMKETEDAFRLARAMVDIGERLGRRVTAIVTDMDQPLGNAIGNGLDVREAIGVLSGEERESPLFAVCMLLAKQIMLAAGKASTPEEAEAKLQKALDTGAALEKFREIIAAQGGDTGVIENPDSLVKARRIEPIPAARDGYVAQMDAEAIGRAAQLLGAGRSRAEDTVDHEVGILMQKRVGDPVKAGEPLALFYINEENHLDQARELFTRAIHLGETRVERSLVYGLVTANGEERFI